MNPIKIATYITAAFSLFLFLPAVQAQRIEPYTGQFGSGRLPNGMGMPGEEERGSHWAEEDTVQKVDVPVGVYVWKIEPRFGTVMPAEPDTVPHLFPNTAFTSGVRGHYNYTGNLGAPRMSRIFTDRRTTAFANPFIFEKPYSFFVTQPEQLLFINTKSPFMNITYHECGNKQNGEDRVKAIFAVNSGKRLGMGFKLDYLYGRGYYESQSTAHFNGTLFASYIADQYQLHAMYYANHLKNSENGGIESDDYVTRPETFPTAYGTADMPTRLSKTWNKLNVNTFYLTHRYTLGFRRYRDKEGNVVRVAAQETRSKLLDRALDLKGDSTAHSTAAASGTASADSAAAGRGVLAAVPAEKGGNGEEEELDMQDLTPEFVPVGGFIHTLRFDHNNRRFLSNLQRSEGSDGYYNDFYLPGDSANDFTKYEHLQNLLAFELREGFNKWVKSGMRLYARHDFYRYTLPDELRRTASFTENHFTVGAQLLKEQGRFFHYKLLGELRTSGTDWGEFNVTADADFNVRLAKDTLRFRLNGYVRNEQPSFYYRHYHARNAWWDNSLDKVLRASAGGELRYKRTRIGANIETLQNYAYFQEHQYPYQNAEGVNLARYGVSVGQTGKNIQVISATLGQDFRLGILNWENEVTWQMSSDKELMPLPALNVYSNIYLLFRIAKVLRTELGADVRYFTEYNAPAYSPIIGQYALQDAAQRIKVGNYPCVNVYANFHLKHTRFYIMGSHVNYSNGGGRPFLLPHYPLNRMVMRLGVSWNFFN